MRLSQILEQPGRFHPRPVVPLPANVPKPAPVANDLIEAWCDEYMARLSITTVRTDDRQGKPSTRTAGTDKAVLGALCSIARDQNCFCIKASEADIAARASIANTDTVSRAIKRLEAAFFLTRQPQTCRHEATKYALCIERLDQQEADGARPARLGDVTDLESIATGDHSHEAFKSKNVGKTATDLYAYLVAHPDLTKAELARATGRGKNTVANNLNKLRALSMVDEEDGKWRVYVRSVRDDDDLTKVVKAAGRRRSAARQARNEERAAREQSNQSLRASLQASEYNKMASEHSIVRDA